MATQSVARLVVCWATVVVSAAALSADTLVLRDGRRITGDLISVRNGSIEFQERGAYGNRVVRVSRDEVRRIELDDYSTGGYEGGPGYGPGGPGGRGAGSRAGMRERQVTVRADTAWSDTGIEVRDGQTLYFEARGEVTWGPGRKDGPEGEKNSPNNPGRPIAGRPGAALIGRVGGSASDFFFVGDERGAIRVRGSGRLFLGINDDYLRDNRGYFTVTVYY
jgi:hypothetical protein